jgi:ribosomal protein S17E
MGTPVSHYIRSVGDIIIEKYPNALSSDFEANKDLVNQLIEYEKTLSTKPSPVYAPGFEYRMKKLRNKIAGYITHEYNKLQREESFPGYSASGSRAQPRQKKSLKRKFKQKPKQPLRLEFLLTNQSRYR